MQSILTRTREPPGPAVQKIPLHFALLQLHFTTIDNLFASTRERPKIQES